MSARQSIAKSELLPNTFPFPNMVIDEREELGGENIWSCLTPPEQAILPIVYRKTFGWWKRTDKISVSQLVKASGKNASTVRKYMKSLTEAGLVILVSSGSDTGDANEWGPQTDDELVNWPYLCSRRTKTKQSSEGKMSRLRMRRKASYATRGVLSHNSPLIAQEGRPLMPQEGRPLMPQEVQKTVKPDKTKRRLPTFALSLENQIAAGILTVTENDLTRLEKVKTAVQQHFRLNVNWNEPRTKNRSFTPDDFLGYMLAEGVTAEQVEAAGKLWFSDKQFNWNRTPTLKQIWEKWPALAEALQGQEPVKTWETV